MAHSSQRLKFKDADVRRKNKGKRKPQQIRHRKAALRSLTNKLHSQSQYEQAVRIQPSTIKEYGARGTKLAVGVGPAALDQLAVHAQ